MTDVLKPNSSEGRIRLVFEIKKVDIDRAKKLLKDTSNSWTCNCPVACAIKRSLGKGVAQVSVSEVDILLTYKSGHQWSAETSKVLAKKIKKYDKDSKPNWIFKPAAMQLGRHVLILEKE